MKLIETIVNTVKNLHKEGKYDYKLFAIYNYAMQIILHYIDDMDNMRQRLSALIAQSQYGFTFAYLHFSCLHVGYVSHTRFIIRQQSIFYESAYYCIRECHYWVVNFPQLCFVLLNARPKLLNKKLVARL